MNTKGKRCQNVPNVTQNLMTLQKNGNMDDLKSKCTDAPIAKINIESTQEMASYDLF